ncbi:NAD(P)-dependent oxidoreductase [Legionella jordanis]|uniref:Erythronate-4-phosphate dehydrogenase n=1 Tax=Legionella jordanis TaxID=456 RepID=A0A0W0V989_9GAMM|nr:NAD(P)-dependent oxidoreductase [Legionella jordanis]KTD16438.1 erythronate-4-phosphate dehydrogenase [Legionella jordanis]RMX04361.1 4-phosphoerythronate dehydrogenase [Legionella jordanis]RMX15551.1 4-phosphoerythronate dehydrogenase [Legionella jordanis]VEH12102.1 erythronate-4-phosphate dehydrogenase [Legionella jordanis]HAT8715001.1 4-phosphoerythronate dehydrogenase [Legionella jordanis]
MNILADATLPGLTAAFPKPFKLSLYHHAKEIPALLPQQNILLCRANLKVDRDLLLNSSLSYVATASSGTDHIDEDFLKTQNIYLIDAKGCNAPAVADYIIAQLAYLKKNTLLQGNKAAVIGAGQVGSKVAQRLKAAGMSVIQFDPPKELRDKSFQSCLLAEVQHCDLISIHANLNALPPYPSRNLINKNVLKRLKDGAIILNASRGGIVNEDDLLEAKPSLIYCTDVYQNEPSISANIVRFATLCTPHIAGHSIEAKDSSVKAVSEKLHKALGLLSPPSLPATITKPVDFPARTDWEDCVLSLYNPIYETEVLKNAKDLESTFLTLRKAHQNRHDFAMYAQSSGSDRHLAAIFGADV